MKDKDDKKHAFLKEDGRISWPKLIIKTFFMFVVIFGIFLIYDKVLKSSVRATMFANNLYENLGYKGVALFVYICDTFIVPMTPDVMFPLVSSQWSIIQITMIMGTASFLGGISAYWLGRSVSLIKIVSRTSERIMGSHKILIHKKGAWAIVLAGLTPIPYSTVCWTAGILKVNFIDVLFACLVRFPRIMIYYYLFKAGVQIINFL
jgi:membrane protein YqaA with SNARE-associated domain